MADNVQLPTWLRKIVRTIKNTPIYRFGLRSYCFFKLYLIGFVSLLLDCVLKHQEPKRVCSSDEWVCIVTGGSGGIGLEVSRELCKRGAYVIIGGHNISAGDDAVRSIKHDVANAKVEFIHLDLGSLKSVRQFVEQFDNKRLPLNLLINNAGVMLVPHTLSEDGLELHMAVNYFGHFLLTNLLLDKLNAAGTATQRARIVNVSSCVHIVGEVDLSDLNSREVYSSHGAYANSKLAIVMNNLLLQDIFHRTGKYITANSCHPGIINTQLYRHVHPILRYLQRAIAKFCFKVPRKGADTILHVALSLNLESTGGKYFDNCTQVPCSNLAADKLQQIKLWNISCKLVGLPESWELPEPEIVPTVAVEGGEPTTVGTLERA